MSPPIDPYNLSAVAAITFDVGGTLISPYPSVGSIYAEILRKYKLTVQPPALDFSFKKAYREIKKPKNDSISEKSEKAYWREIVFATATPFLPKERIISLESAFEELYTTFASAKRWKLSEQARETLEELANRGYRLAILSNGDKRFRQVFAELEMANLFDFIFLSSEIGYEKPDGRIFQQIEGQFQLKPEEILHIGDDLFCDGDGPLLAGWNSLIYSPNKESNGYSTFSRFSELLEILPQKSG